MKTHYTPYFKQKYKSLSREIKNKFKKQIIYLLQNLHHPSLRAKKYDEERDVWQARIDRNFRLYFLIEKNIYILLDIKRHK